MPEAVSRFVPYNFGLSLHVSDWILCELLESLMEHVLMSACCVCIPPPKVSKHGSHFACWQLRRFSGSLLKVSSLVMPSARSAVLSTGDLELLK